MPPENYQQLLDLAARQWGIDPEYWDIYGRRHFTSDETKRAILKGMGVPADNAAHLRESMEAHQRKQWTRLLPACLVVSENEAVDLPLHLPLDLADGAAEIEIREESGQVCTLQFALRDLPVRGAAEYDSRRYVRKEVPLPAGLPLGYHDLEARVGQLRRTTRLIVTPDRAYRHPHLEGGGKLAGVALALYGVRSEHNWGAGDLRDLRAIVDWAAADLEASFVALNPLHAIYNRRPYNTSPYLPECIFYANFLYLDVEAIVDFQSSPRAQRLWKQPETERALAGLRASEFVEYEHVAAWKLRFLKLAFLHFLKEYRADGPRAREFRQYLESEGELLERFATFCALDEYVHWRNPAVWTWREWPAAYQDPDSAETKAFRIKHWRRVLFYSYVHWQLDRQLAAAQEYARNQGLPIGLYQDLALATDHLGADFWAYRRFFANGCSVGSPADDFAPKGQDWGFPPPCSEHHREDGYRLFTESIRRNCRRGGALRIDHVMRFFRLFWIPANSEGGGAYVRENYDDLVRILALESVRQQVVIVGEDLGTVEPFVRETLAEFGILSYRLFYFEKREDGDFKDYGEYPAQALVSSTTHDLPTLAGFWSGEDIEARRRAGLFPDDALYRRQMAERVGEKQKMLDLLLRLELLPPDYPRAASQARELSGELHNAVIGFLALTPCQLLAVNQEDLSKKQRSRTFPRLPGSIPTGAAK